jgi:SAM-dependent methyltransferase
MNLAVEDVRFRLRAGRVVPDGDFDAWLPEAMQRVSRRFWTPIDVTTRVSRWLSEAGARTVLDVGSGSGKFCVVGALRSSLRFTGLEHRGHLVDWARELSARFGVSERIDFVHGALDAVDFQQFDALYFYNPFGENVFPAYDHLDSSVEINRDRFNKEVAKVEHLLERMPVGSHLVTYNGYGGRVPDSYDLVHAKVACITPLRFWRKSREKLQSGYWLEVENESAAPQTLERAYLREGSVTTRPLRVSRR